MTRFQKLILFTGCSGVTMNSLGLATGNDSYNYISIFLGRLSALLYIVEVDKLRVYYLIPLTLSGLNSIINIPQLLFAEYLTQSIIYQIAAYRLFTSVKYINNKV